MRLGLNLSFASSSLAGCIAAGRQAEQAGFQTLYFTEHHFDKDGGDGFANPYAMAAAVSGSLEQAWIGVRPALGLQHPLETVEQSNLLDLLTRGRSLVVLSDDAESGQYAAFGLPTLANGLFEQVVDELLQAWSWHFVEDGPPLEFSAGAHASRMAGRIMPGPCRKPHPLLVREAHEAASVIDAAARGWPVQLRGPNSRALARAYRDALGESGQPRATVEECLRWLVIVVDVMPGGDLARALDECEQAGAAEVRLDPTRGVTLPMLLQMTR